jgi:hypothetical protein
LVEHGPRVAIERRIAARAPIEVDSTLRARVESYASDLRAASDRAPDAGRATLESLPCGRRIEEHADAERGFRLERALRPERGRHRPP